jgi:uncharacterized membrane protein YuzA (DUF378 family)
LLLTLLDRLAVLLLILGGLNWLFVGIFQIDLVAALFGGQDALLSRLTYILVGASAVYVILLWRSILRRWRKESGFKTQGV